MIVQSVAGSNITVLETRFTALLVSRRGKTSQPGTSERARARVTGSEMLKAHRAVTTPGLHAGRPISPIHIPACIAKKWGAVFGGEDDMADGAGE